MIRTPAWQKPLYEASIGVATLLDEIDNELGEDEHDTLYKHAEILQIQITRLENILYKEKSNGF
tara:strand:+ start:132 stop:323 length:192 start_codon:yes stop_codon:yes gene_type:complete